MYWLKVLTTIFGFLRHIYDGSGPNVYLSLPQESSPEPEIASSLTDLNNDVLSEITGFLSSSDRANLRLTSHNFDAFFSHTLLLHYYDQIWDQCVLLIDRRSRRQLFREKSLKVPSYFPINCQASLKQLCQRDPNSIQELVFDEYNIKSLLRFDQHDVLGTCRISSLTVSRPWYFVDAKVIPDQYFNALLNLIRKYKLEKFRFDGWVFGTNHAEALFDALPETIKSLTIRRTNFIVTSTVIDKMKRFDLMYLDLSATVLTGNSMERLAPALSPSLVHLNLGYNSISLGGLNSLAEHTPPNLEYLDLKRNALSNIRALNTTLPKSLKTLIISQNPINNEGAVILAQNMPPGLQKLDIYMTSTREFGLAFLLRNLPSSLRELSFDGCGTLDSIVMRTVEIFPLPPLESLFLHFCSCHGISMERMANVLPASLKTLDLSGSVTHRRDLNAFLKKIPSVEKLYLRLMNMNEKSMEVLSARVVSGELHELSLDASRVRAEALVKFVQNVSSIRTFRYLSLVHVDIPVTTKEWIRDELSDRVLVM